ncbi:MAG: YciI family protein [Gammaproteobacteria bacterium]
MKFLCLAYGAEKDWKALSKAEQDELLTQDEALRKRGALMAAVETGVATVRAWDGRPDVKEGTFAHPDVPLAGFSIIEAENIDEAARLVAGTPCARAKGAIEIRPIMMINDEEYRTGRIQ